MIVLGIETSCDETSIAVLEFDENIKREILINENEYTLFIENFKGKTSELGTQNWNVYSLTFNNCVLTIDTVVNVKGVRFNNTDIIKWTTTQDWERASVDGHSADYLAHAYIDDHCSKVKMATGSNSVIRKRGNIIKL